MFSIKWGIGVGIGVAIAGAGTFAASQLSQNSPAPSPTTSVEPQDAQGVSALGRIAPEGEIFRVGGPSGARIQRLMVREGQQVAPGDTVAILDSFEERKAERDLAANRVLEAQALLQTEEILGKMQTQEAETRLLQAQTPKLRAIQAQGAVVQRIDAELAQAQADLNRYQSLVTQGAVSQQAFENRQLAFHQKQEELRAAQALLEELIADQRASERNAQAQVESTKAASLRAQAQVQLNSAVSNLKLAEAKLSQSIIRVPVAGQVVKVLLRDGEAIEPPMGEGSSGQAIVEIARTQQMYAIAEVYETDIANVERGMLATITSPAIGGELVGVVDQIGLKVGKKDVLSTDPAASTDARVVEVKIRLRDGQRVAGLTNLQVDVMIDTRSGPQT
ncbi:efflux RND transporter periplasmic adaptor subunit [Lyngbya confervoides]|uniref:HlyD family efflux transporter periplasmic adaptor subunit n=1 Tax=Lyngbya confervoides BDU141951 TaxID=1574623 RepID=A0ABD4T6R9_9CYAN|nr:efflux RND transporter periplasmic adaptor subunit [Lyngbya confervoides]MCM1984139.1 HlyD family efflux transporter periplasmic adaptor subunit [Lyngbya confervoides BDU141951]